MKKIRRQLGILLSVFIVITAISGCRSSKTGSEKQSESSQISTDNTLPIVDKSITLKYFTNLDSKVGATMKSYGEVAAFKELEKRTGIHIEFLHPPVGQENEQFNLLLASNNLPDMAYAGWPTIPGGPAKAIEDNSIIKLNDLVNKYAPNFKRVIDSNTEARKQIILDDGTLYMFPSLWYDETVRINAGLMIRKDWLDKLNLKEPTTIDDWYTVLKAFKEKDPNGNGKADEVPFVSDKGAGFKRFSAAWGVPQTGFYQDAGKIKYSFIEPAYKDYLLTMAKWYKEGLIDKEFGAMDAKNFDAKITGEIGGAFTGSLSAHLARYMGLVTPKNPNFKLYGTTFPIGPAGKPYSDEVGYIRATNGNGVAISSQSKYQKEAVRWLDYLYSEEGSKLIHWGIEGQSYIMENGKPKYTELVTKSPDGLPFNNAVSKYCAPHFGLPANKDPEAYKAYSFTIPEQVQAEAAWKASDKSLLVPTLAPSTEESAKIAAIMTEVNTYHSEMFIKFIMGQEPVENFDKYVQSIKKMGIDEVIKIQQTAFDRFKARK